MDRLVVSTHVYEPPEAVYEFLEDFQRYANYSKYLERVKRLEGEGGPGTRYALRFAWWKLTYTAHSEVTAVDPPRSIDWKLLRDIDAHGRWRIEPTEVDPESAPGLDPGDDPVASHVTFEVHFDPESADSGVLDLPPLVSMSWVIGKTIPLVKDEAERVVRRAVADLEGEERPVDLDVSTDSDRI